MHAGACVPTFATWHTNKTELHVYCLMQSMQWTNFEKKFLKVFGKCWRHFGQFWLSFLSM